MRGLLAYLLVLMVALVAANDMSAGAASDPPGGTVDDGLLPDVHFTGPDLPAWVRSGPDGSEAPAHPWEALQKPALPAAQGLRPEPVTLGAAMGLGVDLVRHGSTPAPAGAEDAETKRFDRSPYPAGDVDGDGVEDVHLIGFLYEEPQEETSIVTISGASGAVLRELVYAADVVFPWGVLETDDGPLELLLVQEERFVVPWVEDFDMWYWSGTLYAYQAGSSELVWSVDRPAGFESDGSGWIEFTSIGHEGPYRPGGIQAMENAGVVSWTDTIRNHTVTSKLRLVDPSDRSTIYTFSDDALPYWHWDTDTGRDLYRLVNGTIERRDGADNSVVWTGLHPGFDVASAQPVTVDGNEVLLAESFNASGASLSTIDAMGNALWSRHYIDLPSWTFPVGVAAATGDAQMAFASLDFTCPNEAIPFRLGMMDLGSGDILWERSGDAVDMRGFALAAGDLDGDGVGDPVIYRHGATTSALFSSESCHGEAHSFIVERHEWVRVEVFSAADGRLIADTGDHPTDGIPLLGLNWWGYDRPYWTIPFVHWSFEAGPTGTQNHVDLSIYHPKAQTFRDHHVETYRRDPNSGGGHASLGVFPVGFFDGPLDTVYVYAYDRYTTDGPLSVSPETLSRTALHAHGALDGSPAWQFHRGQPSYDGPIPWV